MKFGKQSYKAKPRNSEFSVEKNLDFPNFVIGAPNKIKITVSSVDSISLFVENVKKTGRKQKRNLKRSHLRTVLVMNINIYP